MTAVPGQDPFDLLLGLERALRAARLDAEGGTALQSWSGLAFRLRDRWLVTPRQDVREVIPLPKLTRVPGAKRWLLGVANVRGALLPVTDLGLWLQQPPSTSDREQRVLVFNSDRLPVGFLVDEVAGHRQFAASDQRPELCARAGTLAPYLLGAFGREGRDWLALSLHKLTQAPAFADAGL